MSAERITSGVREGRIKCDGFGCPETHPLEHEALGEPSFGTGRWLGWLYVDLNRPDLFPRELRFCCTGCCVDWMQREVLTRVRYEPTALDVALRSPEDALARKRAGLKKLPGGAA